MPRPGSLLDSAPEIDSLGFTEELITPAAELDLLERIRYLEFHQMRMRWC